MIRSTSSRLVLAGVLGAAAAGWLGVPLAPSDGSHAAFGGPPGAAGAAVVEGAQAPVRDRAAWQPSPIPSQYSAPAQPAPPAPPAPPEPKPQTAPPPHTAGLALGPQGHVAERGGRSEGPPLGGLGAVLAALSGVGQRPETRPEAESAAGPAASASGAAFIPMTELLSPDTLAAAFGGGLPEQRGAWRHVQFYSRALGREVFYLAWLPPGYDQSTTNYPTLYLLHGVGGGAGFGVEEWLGYALTEDLDRLLALGLIEPLLVVLPNGGQGYWINHAGGGPRWADFVAADLVRHVDATFRTDARRERRAIGGLSMGGHGALQLALNHPDTFGIAGAHSPTLRPYEASPAFFGDPAWFARYDPLSLARATDAARRIATWIDVGSDDRWRPAAEALRSVLAAQRAPLEFRVLEGEHEGWYWQYYLPEYLRFYSDALYATARRRGRPRVPR